MPYKHWRIPTPATNQLRIDTLVAMMYQMGWELHDAGVKGTATLTVTGKPTNGEALTIEGKNYQFRPSPSTEGEILIGATAADCMANLSNAINHLGNPGVDYICAAADPYVTATYDATHVYLTCLRVGDYCRNITTTKTYALATISSATLLGGTPIVLKSNGEKGNRPYGYVAFEPEYSSDNYFIVKPCLYWNEVTHVGSCFVYPLANNYNYIGVSELFFTVCGSKDLVVVHTLLTGSSSGARRLFGHFPAREELITRTTAAISTGRRVSVAVQSAIGFASGMAVTIVGVSEGRDKLLIASVTDDTHIVIENLPRDYAAGVYIGTPAMIFGHNSSSYSYEWYEVAHPDHVGLTEPAIAPISKINPYGNTEISMGDPDDFTGRYKLSSIHVGDASSPSLTALQTDGNFGAIEGCNQGDILFINKDRSNPEAGTISSSTPTTLTDLTKSWIVNSLVGKNICITNGPFSTVVRKIVSNTATVLTVDCDWKIAQLPVPSDYPAPGWSYRIADWTWRVLGDGGAQALSYYGHFCYRETDFAFTL